MKTVGVLLAAGWSRRFGVDDKLLVAFRGRPLVSHSADAMRAAGFDALIAVVGNDAVAEVLGDFALVQRDGDETDQSASLRAGLRAADRMGADRVVIVLGDMPLVTPAHLRAVAARVTDDRAAAITDGTRVMPPAGFPRSLFAALSAATGDRGAQPLLRALPSDALVLVDPALLRDIDVPDDLTIP